MNAQRRVPGILFLAAVVAILAGAGVYTYYAFFAPPPIEPSPVPPQSELISTTRFRCNDVDLLAGGTVVVSPAASLRLEATFVVRDPERAADVPDTFVRIRIEDRRGVIHQSGLAMSRREGNTIHVAKDDIASPIQPGEYTIRLIAAKFPSQDGNELTSRLLCEGKLRVTEAGSGGS